MTRNITNTMWYDGHGMIYHMPYYIPRTRYRVVFLLSCCTLYSCCTSHIVPCLFSFELYPETYTRYSISISTSIVFSYGIPGITYRTAHFLFMISTSTSGSAQTDREVLLIVYRSSGGQSWTHREGWAENADDLGRWFGVTVDGEDRVVKLELQGNNQQGLQNEQKGQGNNVCGKS